MKQCTHVTRSHRVSSHHDLIAACAAGEAHASRLTCHRQSCIEAGRQWVAKQVHMPASDVAVIPLPTELKL